MTIEIQEGETYRYRTTEQAAREDKPEKITKLDIFKEHINEVIVMKHMQDATNVEIRDWFIANHGVDINLGTLSVQIKAIPKHVYETVVADSILQSQIQQQKFVIFELSDAMKQIQRARLKVKDEDIHNINKCVSTLILASNELTNITNQLKSNVITKANSKTVEEIFEELQEIKNIER